MPLSDRQIIDRCTNEKMISPFLRSTLQKDGVISYGVTSYGYDVRIAPNFLIVDRDARIVKGDVAIIDPKRHCPDLWRKVDASESGYIDIPPHGFALGSTVETLKVPRDLHVICLGKSTYARCGLIINVTPLEPEWEGTVTIELHNTTDLPIRVYANEGISQFIFLKAHEVCEVSYADKGGKYQNQSGITHAEVVQ